MKRLLCTLLLILFAVPAHAREISKADWTGSDDCQNGKGDCFAQTLHVDDGFGEYRLVVRFVIGKLAESGHFQAGFEAALVPKEGTVKAVVRKVIFHTDGPPQSFVSSKAKTNDQGLTYTETFSLFKEGDAAIVDLVDYLKSAGSLRLTLLIEREGVLTDRDIEVSLKGSSHVLKKAFGDLERRMEYEPLLSLDLLAAVPVENIKSCISVSGLAAVLAEESGGLDCDDLAVFDAGGRKLVYKLASAENDGLVFLRMNRTTFRTINGNLTCDIVLGEKPEKISENEAFFFVQAGERCGGHALMVKLPKPGGSPVKLSSDLSKSDAFKAFAADLYGDDAKAAATLYE